MMFNAQTNAPLLAGLTVEDLYVPPGMMYCIVVENPQGGDPFRLRLSQTQTTIGRGDWNDIELPLEILSSQHCAIVFFRNRFLLKDLGSSNGTYLLPGYQLANFDEIKPGDRFLMANLNVHFEYTRVQGESTVQKRPSTFGTRELPKLSGPLKAETLSPGREDGAASPSASKPKRRSIFGLGK